MEIEARFGRDFGDSWEADNEEGWSIADVDSEETAKTRRGNRPDI
jgi:hypothetical protein